MPVIMAKNGKVIKHFRSLKEAGRYMHTRPETIKYVCLYSKTHIYKHNYEFYFKENENGT